MKREEDEEMPVTTGKRRMSRKKATVINSDDDDDGETALALTPTIKVETATTATTTATKATPKDEEKEKIKAKATVKEEPTSEGEKPPAKKTPKKEAAAAPQPKTAEKAKADRETKKRVKEECESEASSSSSYSGSSSSSYSDSDSDSDAKAKKKTKTKRKPAPKESESESDFEDSADDEDDGKKKGKKKTKPKAKPKESAKKSPKKAKAKKAKKEDDGDSDSEKESGGSEDDEGSGEEGEVSAKKGEVRWRTLKHNGPMFPPPYEPHGVPLVYDGKEVVLPPAAEEAASFFARYTKSDHVKKPQFTANFWDDFRELLGTLPDKSLKKDLTRFELCDFSRITAHLEAESEKKKTKTKSEKQRLKAEKEEQRKKYGVAIVDGKEQRVGNFMVEPPGLFLGRGDHPKTGKIKPRIEPEDVTLNLGEGEELPPCPVPGHSWGGVEHNRRRTWLAMWHEGVNGQNKYVWLHASSSIKGSSDKLKYETARKLKDKIKTIRDSYTKDLKSKVRLERQRAVAIYLIDRLALRVGGEKGEDEADTVGCCSLRVEHVSFPDPPPEGKKCVVAFDFLGKDSMRYKNDVEIDPAVYEVMKTFLKGSNGKPKKKDEELFDELSTSALNDHLKTFMNGLSAKVFRTYNASITLQQELAKEPTGFSGMTVDSKVLFYNRCNKQVAILCNHQRTMKEGSFSSAIGGFKDLLHELVKQRKLLIAEIERHGGKVKGKGKSVKSPKKKAKGKKGKGGDSEADDDFEKAPKKKKAKKPKKGDGSDEESGDGKKDEQDEEARVEAAADAIDEEAIKSDDSDIETYRKTKEEREKLKIEREKKVKEKEAAEAAASGQPKEEASEDEKKSKKTKKAAKKESDDEDSDDESEDGSKKKKKKKSSKKSKEDAKEEKRRKKEEKEEEEDEKAKKGFELPSTLGGCETRLAQVNARIDKTKVKMVERGELRNVALSTSKINYMDPRITVAWSKRAEVPLERVFQKTLRDKFTWALDVEPDFLW